MATLKLKYSVSGHFHTRLSVSDSAISHEIALDAQHKIREHLKQYGLVNNPMECSRTDMFSPFVFRNGGGNTPESDEVDKDNDAPDHVYYDDLIEVLVHFPSNLELNRFKIMYENLHPHINGKEIRINL